MKVFKIELCIIDFDEVGETGIKDMLEYQKYPNYCINPKVKSIESRDIKWSDEHPLNKRDTADTEFKRLFEK